MDSPTYKSDLFEFIHPTGHVKCPYYLDSNAFFDESVENTHKISPDPFIQIKARAEGAASKGGMVVFPKQRSEDMQKKLYDMVRIAVNDVVCELKKDYLDEPLESYRIFNPPTSVFRSQFSNRATGETFCEKSLVVQFGGLRGYTLDYVIDQLFSIVRSVFGKGEGSVLSSVLAYDLNSRRFYQYGYREEDVFKRPFTARHERELLEYTLDNSSLVD